MGVVAVIWVFERGRGRPLKVVWTWRDFVVDRVSVGGRSGVMSCGSWWVTGSRDFGVRCSD
jgi:hypothetical protein